MWLIDFAVDNETTFISVEVGLAIDTSMDALSIHQHFPCQDSQTIDPPKFYPTRILHYIILWYLATVAR